jgi:hypothetical protein
MTPEAETSPGAVIAWPPPLEDEALLEILTDGACTRAETEVSEVLANLRGNLTVRAGATIGLAVLLRDHLDTPLRALLCTAQDLLGPESEETCENVLGLLRAGWSQGAGELLAAARAL